MRRRLWLVDLTLLGFVILTAVELNHRREQSLSREQALLRQMVPVVNPPILAPMVAVSPSMPAEYIEIAQRFLFSRDRNATVILDPPPPPPPPKPMPSLPTTSGVIDFGTGPTVLMSEKPGGEYKGYRVGEKIGEFTLVAANSQEIVLEWEGKQVRKRVAELIDKRAGEQVQQTAQAPAAAPQSPTSLTAIGKAQGPGVELGPTSRACLPNDAAAPGTVQDGYRKVVSKTPFGESCRWEAVK